MAMGLGCKAGHDNIGRGCGILRIPPKLTMLYSLTPIVRDSGRSKTDHVKLLWSCYLIKSRKNRFLGEVLTVRASLSRPSKIFARVIQAALLTKSCSLTRKQLQQLNTCNQKKHT